jgi:hypothetical protein
MMDMYLVIFAIVLIAAMFWHFALEPYLLSKGVNVITLEFVTQIVDRAVRAAEQMYKVGTVANRKAYAHKLIHDALTELGIDAESYADMVDWLIEAAVQQLPKTHQND